MGQRGERRGRREATGGGSKRGEGYFKGDKPSGYISVFPPPFFLPSSNALLVHLPSALLGPTQDFQMSTRVVESTTGVPNKS